MEKAAQDVGERGTLLIFWTSHGGPGVLAMEDGKNVPFQEIGKALSKNRRRPIKRLVFVIHACYSGSSIQITDPVFSKELNKALLANIDWYNEELSKQSNLDRLKVDDDRLTQSGLKYLIENSDPFYGQIAIFTSSSKTEYSFLNDDGSFYIKSFIAAWSKSSFHPTFQILITVS